MIPVANITEQDLPPEVDKAAFLDWQKAFLRQRLVGIILLSVFVVLLIVAMAVTQQFIVAAPGIIFLLPIAIMSFITQSKFKKAGLTPQNLRAIRKGEYRNS